VRVGDTIELPTPSGLKPLTVAGVVVDYSPVGGVIMELTSFSSLFPGDDFRVLWVWTDSPPHEFVERALAKSQDGQLLQFMYGEEARRFGSRLFERFASLFVFMSGLASAVGALVVANLLLGSVIERRREVGLLRIAGVQNAQLIRAVILDSLTTAMIGAVIGIALSTIWARPMLGVLAEAFGWELDYVYTPSHFAVSVGIAATLGLLAGLYPSWRARNTSSALQPLFD
jgi:putative ABC transport system permease protein